MAGRICLLNRLHSLLQRRTLRQTGQATTKSFNSKTASGRKRRRNTIMLAIPSRWQP